MSMYEYGTGQQGLNYPNPYRFENYMLSIKVGIFLFATLYLLFLSRANLQEKQIYALLITMVAAIMFLVFAINCAIRVSKQLRVYFGRGQPASLTPDINPNSFGSTQESEKLKETIRQGAIYIDTPPGNLNGFLYAQFKNLIIAPKEIQALFQHCFSNIVKMLTLFGLFVISAFLAIGSNLNGWLGILYSSVAIILILNPLFRRKVNDVNLNLGKFWVLLGITLLVTVGFVLYQEVLPNVSKYNFGWQTLVLTFLAVVGELVILRALYFQLEKPIGLTTAFQQESITFNTNPSQLALEAERKLQQGWNMQIPHRIYSRIHPYIQTEQKKGKFKIELMQESQPIAPKALSEGLTLETILADNRKKHIFIVNVMAVVVALFATIGLTYVATEAQSIHSVDYETLAWTPLLIGTLGLSMYWMKVMHGLWGRFDFESTLYIIESEGDFVTSQVNFGNQIKDSLQASKEVITCENMTLRVWVTHLKTSVFGHGMTGVGAGLNPRRIIFMTGLKDQSIAWVESLKEFANNQSMLISPTSNQDLTRMTQLSQMNAVAKTIQENASSQLLGVVNKEDLTKVEKKSNEENMNGDEVNSAILKNNINNQE